MQCSAVQGGAGECTGGQDLCKKSVLVWGEVGKGERQGEIGQEEGSRGSWGRDRERGRGMLLRNSQTSV